MDDSTCNYVLSSNFQQLCKNSGVTKHKPNIIEVRDRRITSLEKRKEENKSSRSSETLSQEDRAQVTEQDTSILFWP